jgi:rfaE bifunctional protein nucleotidyltransferase chain/domain
VGKQNVTRAKVKSLLDLASDAEKYRAAGQRVVLTNGVFDLLHLGHVRYFEEARKQGDILLVAITADEFVNKGPSRPHFPQDIRAEMVGALNCVDGIVVTPSWGAVEVIEAIKPDVYVKGPEYKDKTASNLVEEQRAAERNGGCIYFTNDITFSSSALINQYLDTSSPELHAYLTSARQQKFEQRIPDLIAKIAGMKVMVVGETIIDEYIYVSPLGKPPKENVLASLRLNSEIFAGGVIATANHVASFCDSVEVFTCLGGAESYEQLVQTSLLPNVKLWSAVKPTVRKTRFIDSAYLRKLFEVYTMDDAPLSEAVSSVFVEEIERRAKDFDVVLVNDFGHGLFTPEIRSALSANSKFLALNVQSNAGNFGYNLATKYPKADYLCLDAPEARLALSTREADLGVVAAALCERIDTSRIILTHGREGCITYNDRTGEVSQVPALTSRIVDTMGAGDAFFAVTAPLAAISDDLGMVGFIGNAVGAIKVGILGHRKAVEKGPTLAYIRTLLK